PDDVRPRTECEEARLRGVGVLASVGVEPPHQAVARVEFGRRRRLVDPVLGEDLPPIPFAATEVQVPEACVVEGADPDPTPPVPPAADRLDPPPVDREIGVVISVPLPGIRGA